MKSLTPFLTPAVALTLGLINTALEAGDKVPISDPEFALEDGLDATLRLNGWAASLKGDIGAGGFIAPVDLSFSDIVKNLNMVAAGSLALNQGRWGLLVDATYIELGAPTPDLRIPLFSVNGITVEQFVGSGLISYRLAGDRDSFLDAVGGVQYLWMRNQIDLSPGPARGPVTRSVSDSNGWADPVIGLRGEHYFTDRIYGQAFGSIGGFGVSSELTWSVAGGLGYHLTDRVALDFIYRYFSVEYDRKLRFDASMHGPFVGLRIDF